MNKQLLSFGEKGCNGNPDFFRKVVADSLGAGTFQSLRPPADCVERCRHQPVRVSVRSIDFAMRTRNTPISTPLQDRGLTPTG